MPVIKKISPLKMYQNERREVTIVEAVIRPTGLLDPEIILRPVDNQVDNVLEEVRKRVLKGQRVLITALTKKFAEELDIYMKQINIKSAYIHSDVQTMDRVDILADLRRGRYDVLIGINLLREGLDLPEVSLVAIFDADKEGFLRSKTSLIQIIGRAARHEEGKVIMYAKNITKAMQDAINETDRRRAIQQEYNQKHNITPVSTKREMQTIADDVRAEIENDEEYGKAGAMLTVSGFEEIENNGKKQNGRNAKNALDEGIEIENRFKRRGKGGRSRSVNNVNTVDTNELIGQKGKQVYDGFEAKKEAYLKELKTKNLSQASLQSRLYIAVEAYDFEMAAAIRDIMKEQEENS